MLPTATCSQNETRRADSVRLASRLTSIEQRDEAMARVLEEIRKKDSFVTLKGWRHEVHCFVVAICSLVHNVEAMHGLCYPLKAFENLF